MPTTSNFGWTTPADTDLVKDGAAAIRTLGNGIDTSLVDLKGGTTGQVLSKNSNTDLDYTWVTPNVGDITEVQAGTGISVASGTGPIPVVTNSMATEITAKGDLIVGTGSGTFDNLPVGTNGHTLVADSSTATGLKWAAPSSTPTFVGASVYNSGAQEIQHDTQTVVTWDSENFDTDGFHSTTTNTGRFTIPAGKGGKYLVTATGWWSTNTTGIRTMYLQKNGTDYVALERTPASNSNPTNGNAHVLDLAAGDYVQVTVYQTSGGAVNFSSNSPAGLFTISFLGA